MDLRFKADYEAAFRQEYTAPVEIHLFDELESTNLWLTRAASRSGVEAIEFPDSVCLATIQTAGIGRRGKLWHSPPESITFSIAKRINRPVSELMGLSLVAGVAVVEVLSEYFPESLLLKWPNDILVGDRKLGGILVEVRRVEEAATLTITGCGLNVARGSELDAVDQPVAALADLGMPVPPRSELAGRLAGALFREFSTFEEKGWPFFASRWIERDYLRGKRVSISGTHPVSMGKVVGVGDNGCLLVSSDGELHELLSGEVSVRNLE